MRAKDSLRTGGEILIDQLVISRRAPHVLRAGRELHRGARCLSRQRACRHHLPARERRRHHGGSRRQGDRPARHLLRHPRSRRHQRVGRPAHRTAGFHADDPVRRAGRAPHARARSVPGARLPRGVRHHRQMGDRNRRSRAHPRADLARLLHGDQRPARPGRHRAARGHADRARRGRGCAGLRAGRDLARSHRHEPAAEDDLGGRAADRAARRQPLVGGRVRVGRTLRRTFCTSGCHHVPPRAPVRSGSPLLRRRPRHRAQSQSCSRA